ncbi:MAG: response regulator [Planctomycetota bacterium]
MTTQTLLPRAVAVPTPQRTAAPTATQRSTRILLVEDEPLTAEVFARALARDGFVVDVARDGRQALRKFLDQVPSLCVLDISLPALSGVDVVRELRAKGHHDLPIVIVSGSARRATDLTAGELWPGAWLDKPVKPKDLVAVVREFVHDGEQRAGGAVGTSGPRTR